MCTQTGRHGSCVRGGGGVALPADQRRRRAPRLISPGVQRSIQQPRSEFRTYPLEIEPRTPSRGRSTADARPGRQNCGPLSGYRPSSLPTAGAFANSATPPSAARGTKAHRSAGAVARVLDLRVMSLDLRVGRSWSQPVRMPLTWAHLIQSLVAVGRRRTPLVGVSLSTRCHRHMDSVAIIGFLGSVRSPVSFPLLSAPTRTFPP